MTTTVRSVRVELEMGIAGYVANARIAGHETDKAFSGAEERISATSQAVSRLDRNTGNLAKTSTQARVQQSSLGREIEKAVTSANRAGPAIDRYSGRLRLLTETALLLGPVLGSVAAGGAVALSAQLGATVGALGVTLLAVNGLGDGLKALDAYQLEPTTENLAKVQQQMEKLGPSGEHFVRFLDGLEPTLKQLQFAARDGLFPGAEDGIDALLQRLPELKALISGFADELGSLSRDAGEALAGDGFDKFFSYLKTDGVKLLDDTSRTVGNLAESVANLFAGFGGVSSDFSGGLLKFSQGLEKASENLDTNQGFQDFLDYIRTEGPHALETIGSIADALLQIVEAAAPLGGPVLTAVKAFADALASIAGSDLGTPIFTALAALALYNRALRATAALNATAWGGAAISSMTGFKTALTTVITAQDRARLSAQELVAVEAERNAAMRGGLATFGKGAALIGALAITSSDYAQQTGLSNTASLGLAGTMAGPLGGALGTAAGFTLDLKHANDDLNDSLRAMDLAAASGDMDAYSASIDKSAASFNALGQSPGFTSLFHLGGAANFIKSDLTQQFDSLTGKTHDAAQAIMEASKEQQALASGAETAFNPVSALAGAITNAAESAQAEAQALQDATDAMQKSRQEALRALDAELNYHQAVLDANGALKENGKDFSKTSEAGIKNRQVVYALADAWNQQSDAAKNAKGSLASARSNFIQTAEDLGATAVQAHNLANRLFEIPPKRKTEITADTSQAEAAIARLNAIKLATKVIHVTVDRAFGALTGFGIAAGGTVPGPRMPYGDKVLAHLAPGEEVISNSHGQADRFRSDRASGRIPAYAAGGTVEDRIASTYTSRYRGYADGGTVDPTDDPTDPKKKHGKPRPPFTAFLPEDVANSLDGVKDAATRLDRALKGLQTAADKVKASYDKEKSKLDDLISQRSSLASSIASSAVHDPFGNGVAGLDAQVQADTGDIDAMTAALATLVKNGLDPKSALYQQLAASMDVNTAQQLAQLSAGDLQSRAVAFQHRADEAGVLSGTVAGQALNDAIHEQSQTNRELRGTLKDLQHEIHSIGEQVRRGAHDGTKEGAQEGAAAGAEAGTRAGHEEKRRRTAAAVRTGSR